MKSLEQLAEEARRAYQHLDAMGIRKTMTCIRLAAGNDSVDKKRAAAEWRRARDLLKELEADPTGMGETQKRVVRSYARRIGDNRMPGR